MTDAATTGDTGATGDENILSGVEVPEAEGQGATADVRDNAQAPAPSEPQGAEYTRDDAGTAGTENDPNAQEERPPWLPEKFKTPEDLVKAYNEMGKKIREKHGPPEQYEIELPEGVGELSEQDVEAFKNMGLTNDQAQNLVNHFYQEVVPAIQDARADAERARLASVWNMGSPDSHEFHQRLTEVKSWASRNLPEAVVNEMAKTHNGVNALYQMMQQGAERNQVKPASAQSRPSQKELMDLMNDERYLKRDPDFMEYVNRRFREAYD